MLEADGKHIHSPPSFIGQTQAASEELQTDGRWWETRRWTALRLLLSPLPSPDVVSLGVAEFLSLSLSKKKATGITGVETAFHLPASLIYQRCLVNLVTISRIFSFDL